MHKTLITRIQRLMRHVAKVTGERVVLVEMLRLQGGQIPVFELRGRMPPGAEEKLTPVRQSA